MLVHSESCLEDKVMNFSPLKVRVQICICWFLCASFILLCFRAETATFNHEKLAHLRTTFHDPTHYLAVRIHIYNWLTLCACSACLGDLCCYKRFSASPSQSRCLHHHCTYYVRYVAIIVFAKFVLQLSHMQLYLRAKGCLFTLGTAL